MSRFAGTRVLLIAPADDALHAHEGLRRRALQRLGCTVTRLDPQEGPGLIARIRGDTSLASRIERALASANPDLVLVTGGDETLDPALAAELRGTTDAVWACWLTGHSYGLNLLQRTAGVYDVIAAAASDVSARLRGTGAGHVLYLPLACDPSVHRPVRTRPDLRSSIAFVGSATPRRESLLGQVADLGLAVWGTGWEQTGLRGICRGTLLTQQDYVRVYAGAVVALNIHDASELQGWDGWGCNRRVFELAAIGAPQVVDSRHDLTKHFADPDEVLVFRSPGELRNLVERALRDPVWAERAAAAARARAMKEHTYMHRMERLLGVVRRR